MISTLADSEIVWPLTLVEEALTDDYFPITQK